MMQDFRFKNNTGFTLMEVLVVMGILAILSTLGYLVTIDMYKSYAFNSERDTIVSLLQKARAQSLSNINQSAHGVHFDSNQYVVFQGSSYNSGSPYNQAIPSFPGVSHNALPDVVFSQLSGNSSVSASLNLSDGKRSATITLNSEGQINW